MRINLDPEIGTFLKQMKALRRMIDAEEQKGGQEAVSARLMGQAFLPYCTALRTEIRSGETLPDAIWTAAEVLLSNIAIVTVRSLIAAPPHIEVQMVDTLMKRATLLALSAMEDQFKEEKARADARAAADKPKLSLVPKTADDKIIEFPTRGE